MARTRAVELFRFPSTPNCMSCRKVPVSVLRRGVGHEGLCFQFYDVLPLAHRISTLLDFAEYLVFICDFSQADFFAAFEKILSRAQNRGLC